MSRFTLADEYAARYGSDKAGIQAMAADLMRGDPARFKAGYSRENAVIATAEAFGEARETVDLLVPR